MTEQRVIVMRHSRNTPTLGVLVTARLLTARTLRVSVTSTSDLIALIQECFIDITGLFFLPVHLLLLMSR